MLVFFKDSSNNIYKLYLYLLQIAKYVFISYAFYYTFPNCPLYKKSHIL